MITKEPFLLKGSLLQIESWTSIYPNIVAGITTRNGGFSKEPFGSMNLGLHVEDRYEDVVRNRVHLADVIGAPLTTWVCGEQVHGAKITEVTKEDLGNGSIDMESALKGVDGLYTKEKNLFLIAGYADCVPLYFFAPSKNAIGIAHAGWKGTVGNIATEMIQLWTTVEKIPFHDIFVCIGPSIGQCCYIVDDNVIEKLAKVLDEIAIKKVYNKISVGQYSLDLKQANYELLTKAGVLSNHIEISNYCTSCHPELFFSHRRDKGKTGRMASFIGIKD